MNTQATSLQPHIRREVELGANLYTDKYPGYKHLDEEFIHGVINHAVEYVRGNVHTNGIENFWSLLKRTLKGTYVSVEPFHLFRYLTNKPTDSTSGKCQTSRGLSESWRW